MAEPALLYKLASGANPAAVRSVLNEVYSILGTTKRAIWPCFENTGSLVYGAAASNLTSRDEAAARTLDSEWNPRALRASQLFAYLNPAATNNHFSAGDAADYTHGNGTVDTPFSAGMWIAPTDITAVVLLSKYDAVGTLREWAFRLNASSKLELELYDESADASEIAEGENALVAHKMQFVVVTYDGLETSPTIKFYQDGVHDGGAGASVETGSYVAMEDLACVLNVGASGAVTAPVERFDGWLTMPFVTGKELTAAEVASLYGLTRGLVGA